MLPPITTARSAPSHSLLDLTLPLLAVALAAMGCGGDEFASSPTAGTGGTGASTTGGAGGHGALSTGGLGGGGGTSTGGGGTGGTAPCDPACEGDTPYCDGGTCVACLEHSHCDDPANAQCDGGSCVPCDASPQCATHPGTLVCDAGTCVECSIDDDAACTNTCNLLTSTCSTTPAGSLDTCQACTHDDQCEADHKCVPMDYDGSFHGYFCLEQVGACDNPFAVGHNAASLGGEPAQLYCGVDTALVTCDAVFALLNNWQCSGSDGMCSPNGIQAEQPVPAALCRTVGALANRCTYRCSGAVNCPGVPANTCNDGPLNMPPNYCGG